MWLDKDPVWQNALSTVFELLRQLGSNYCSRSQIWLCDLSSVESLALVLPQPNFPMEDKSHNPQANILDLIHLHYCNVTSSFILGICPLLEIERGTVSYEPDVTPPRPSINTVGNYTCNNGLQLNGPRMRTCQSNGMWMPPVATMPSTCE